MPEILKNWFKRNESAAWAALFAIYVLGLLIVAISEIFGLGWF